MHPTAKKFAESAKALGLEVEIRQFEATTRTAEDAANAIGCTVGQIVKSLVFLVDGEAVMTLVSGPNRLDEKKLAGLCGVGRKKVKRADADKVREVTGYSIGGVPPFAHAKSLRTFIDEDFFQYDAVWAAGGTSNAVFPIAPDVLARTTGGEAVALKSDN
ncbi:MAG: YbaK/EbsC family protein [Gammaproteobacteria bacterium]|nr:YbaK/EbsC family protein [Gammaproteobacteria bacterium]